MELRPTFATAKGPATTFTGDVWLDRIAGGDDESRLVVPGQDVGSGVPG
jgi:hypothetical protein